MNESGDLKPHALAARLRRGMLGPASEASLSIIIVNYRAWPHLDKCLQSLDHERYGWEVIVVDNCSADGNLDAFVQRYAQVVLIANPTNSGFAHACNVGAAQASGKLLLFLNPDVIARPEAISTLMAEKARHNVGILTCRQVSGQGRVQKAFDSFPDLLSYFKTFKIVLRQFAPKDHPDPRRPHRELVSCDWVSGSVVLIGREDFHALQGWSEDYWMYAEDTDLCYRAKQRGLSVAYTPQVEVIHEHGGASRQNPQITVLTKLETIISKHVFNAKHRYGLHRWLNHGIVTAKSLMPLALASFLDVLTLGRVQELRLRAKLFSQLLKYYAGVLRHGSWLSPRSVNYGEGRRDLRSSQEG